MAIAFDASSAAASSSASTSLTWAHTCTGSNGILFVGSGGNVASTDDITGITYNGVALTKAQGGQISGDRYVGLWYLANPSTGSHNIVISFTGNFMDGVATSYTGASSTLDNSTIGFVTANLNASQAITTVANNSWAVANFGAAAGGAFTAGANTTKRVQTSTQGVTLVDSGGPVTPAGSITLNGSKPFSNTWAIPIVSIAPGGVVVTNPPFRTLLGVGI